MGGVTDREADSAVPAAAVPFDLASMRKQYRAEGLSETELAATPVEQFARWFKQAATDGGLFEPNAMVVSTADTEGRPSSRTVLLKHFDAQGFVFYTNYDSRKGRELDANPYVSLLFPWHPMARQVVVTGMARRTGRDETAAYFRTRPHGSQLGAWASVQSSVVADRRALDVRTPSWRRAIRRASRCRCRRTGAGSGWCLRRWSSGRAGRTGCTTGCGTWRRAAGAGGWSG